MSYFNRLSGICTAANRRFANNLATKMGFGDIFSVPLSPSGKGRPTHYGFHSYVRPEFHIDFLRARKDKNPNLVKRWDMKPFNRTAKEDQVFNLVQYSVGDFAAFIKSEGLVVIGQDSVTEPRPGLRSGRN